MPSQPETVNDTVLYLPRNFYGDKDITVRMLDGSILDIWGPVFVNGNALVDVGMLPIASNAEALAGTDNTKVMTPLRVAESITNKLNPLIFSNGSSINGSGFGVDYTSPAPTSRHLFIVNSNPKFIVSENYIEAYVYFNAETINANGWITVPDEIYGVAWNGNLEVPTKNALYDKIETLGAGITEAAADIRYVNSSGDTINGTLQLHNPDSHVLFDDIATQRVVFQGLGSIRGDLGIRVVLDGDSTFVVRIYGGNVATFTSTGITAAVDIVVPDEAYGAGWNGSLEVPTKNAVYNKIETLGSGGGVSDVVWVGTDAPVDPDIELWFDTDESAVSNGVTGSADKLYLLRTTV